MIKPVKKTEVVEKVYWECRNKGHRHRTKQAALNCIERDPCTINSENFISGNDRMIMTKVRDLYFLFDYIVLNNYAEVGRVKNVSMTTARNKVLRAYRFLLVNGYIEAGFDNIFSFSKKTGERIIKDLESGLDDIKNRGW